MWRLFIYLVVYLALPNQSTIFTYIKIKEHGDNYILTTAITVDPSLMNINN